MHFYSKIAMKRAMKVQEVFRGRAGLTVGRITRHSRTPRNARQRRICRSLIPMISAARHHVIFFAMARK
jgi:hypothetical protein